MLKLYILPDTFPQRQLQIPRSELVHIGGTVEWWEQQAVMRHCDNSFISVRATATAPHGSHPTRPTWGLSALLGPHSEKERGDVQSYEVRMVQSIVTMKSLVQCKKKKVLIYIWKRNDFLFSIRAPLAQSFKSQTTATMVGGPKTYWNDLIAGGLKRSKLTCFCHFCFTQSEDQDRFQGRGLCWPPTAHCAGRHLRPKLMSQYIGSSQKKRFDAGIQEMVSKVQKFGYFWRYKYSLFWLF